MQTTYLSLAASLLHFELAGEIEVADVTSKSIATRQTDCAPKPELRPQQQGVWTPKSSWI